jgi:hypothetical protein
MATAEWESYVLSGRFKTKRRRKRLAIKGRDKQLIHLYKELKDVVRQQRNLGYRDLDPPVQRGWKRSFVLRPDVAASPHAAFFTALLEKANTTTFSHRKDFKIKRRRHGKKVYVDKPQRLRSFYNYEFVKLKLMNKEKPYFKEDWEYNLWNGELQRVYLFTEPWRFVLKVQPNMITKVPIIDPQLRSREKELDNYFERNKLYPRLFKLTRGKHPWRWDSFTEKAKYAALLEIDPFDELNNEAP